MQRSYRSDDVIEGLDGWLFHGQGSNAWLEYALGQRHISESIVNDWKVLLRYWEHCADKAGARIVVVIVPEKHIIARRFLPSIFKLAEPGPLQYLESFICKSNIYTPLISHFLNNENRGDLFLKTDSHWSMKGAYLAYQVIAERLKVDPLQEGREFWIRTVSVDYIGDLGKRMNPPCTERRCEMEFAFPVRKVYDNGVRNIGRLLIFDCREAKVNQTICIYGNSFTEYGLLDLICRTFRRTVFAFSPGIDKGITKEIKADIVVYQSNERFLPVSPRVSGHIAFRARVLVKRVVVGAMQRMENAGGSDRTLGALLIADRIYAECKEGSVASISKLVENAESFLNPAEVSLLVYLSTIVGRPEIYANLADIFRWQKYKSAEDAKVLFIEHALRYAERGI